METVKLGISLSDDGWSVTIHRGNAVADHIYHTHRDRACAHYERAALASLLKFLRVPYELLGEEPCRLLGEEVAK